MTETPPKSKLAARIDWLFTLACIFASGALAVALILFILGGFFPQMFEQDFGFGSFGQAIFTVALTGAIIILALLPFFSLPYLLSSLFSDNSFNSKGLALSTVAVISSAMALMFSIDAGVCTRVAGAGGNCAPFQLAYVVDQFSKGGFADVFDIYDFKISRISTSELSSLGKIYTLNFRMISALYLAMVVFAIYRRFTKKDAT